MIQVETRSYSRLPATLRNPALPLYISYRDWATMWANAEASDE